jgi:putative flippase GtrA
MLFSLLLFFLVPLARAQWYGYFPLKPAELVQNEWAIFTVLFAIFYSAIYFSLGNVMKGNKAAPAVIAIAISFLVTAGIQRNWTFLERPIMFWALILALVLVVLTFFRAMAIGPAGLVGLILLLLGFWPIVKNSIGINSIAMFPYWLVSFLDTLSPFAMWMLIIGIVAVLWAWFKSLGRQRQRIYLGG